MASNGRHDQTIPALGRYWDELVQGRPADPGDLDPALAAVVRQLHARDDALGADPDFAARLFADLEDQMPTAHLELTHRPGLPPLRLGSTRGPNDRVADRPMRTPWRPVWSALAPIASAVLVVVAFVTAYLAGGLSRSAQPNEPPAQLPALMALATPAPSEPTMETLLDTTSETLPTGHALIEVIQWTLQPGPTPLTLPAIDGVVIVVPESGEITATQSTSETRLVVGDPFVPAKQEVAFRPAGASAATMISVVVDSAHEGHGYWSTDPMAHDGQSVISTSADTLPGGAARLVVERLTLPPGSALPAHEASPLVWTGVGAGTLGLTLEGQHLPFRWKSGTERTFRAGQFLPALQPGTVMTLRNAGDDALVLYRLTITPRGAEGAATGTPAP
jgi:hypothetical protein